MEPHKFVSNCRVPGCTSAHYFCQVPECGAPATDSIHQQESQQCGSCAGNLPNHEEGCFYKLAQEGQPATHPAEGLRAVEAFYKGQIAQAQKRIAELKEGFQAAYELAKDGYPTACEEMLQELLEERIK